MTAEQTQTVELELHTDFFISSTLLRQAIAKVLPFISTNPVVPILENSLWVVKDNTLRIVGSDLQSSIAVSIPVENDNAVMACVPLRAVAALLATLPEQPLTIRLFEDKLIIANHDGSAEYTFADLERWLDFPKLPEFSPVSRFSLPVTQLRDLFRMGIAYLSNDDLRPAMTGIHWTVGNEEATTMGHELAATDGHRLLRLTPDIKDIPEYFKAIIPGPAARRLVTILPKAGDDVSVEIGLLNARFSWGQYTVTTRLVDEQFPNYNKAIPEETATKVRLVKSELLSAIRRASVFANRTTKQISFQFKPEGSTVHAQDLDYSNRMKEKLSPLEMVGDGMTIGVNAKLLIDVLKAIPASQVEVCLSAPNRALVFLGYQGGKTDTTSLHLQMPVMLNQYD